jgi:tryptophan synthase alpha chain
MSTTTHTGLDAVAAIFDRARAANRAAFLPYFPIGYPDYDTSLDAVQAMAEVGVDGFEIGIPFSDPLADGPTIQAATQIALENGTTVRTCLQAVAELRERGVSQPMLLMGYLNPLLAYGIEAFVRDAKAAGADGLIIPDLPPEEAALVKTACKQQSLALIFFLAPTSNEKRIKLVDEQVSGFIYAVSLTGITGARADLPPGLTDFIARIRNITDQPVVLGFGISQPEHARAMNGLVDGFIVGSALVKAGKQGVEAVRRLTETLFDALST